MGNRAAPGGTAAEEVRRDEVRRPQSCGGSRTLAVVRLFKNFIKVQTRPLTLTPTSLTLTAFNPNGV